MECPHCAAEVPKGALYCPRCHEALGLTQKLPRPDQLVWCPACGALLPPGAEVCSKCGTVLKQPETPQRKIRDLKVPKVDQTALLDIPSIRAALEKTAYGAGTDVRQDAGSEAAAGGALGAADSAGSADALPAEASAAAARTGHGHQHVPGAPDIPDPLAPEGAQRTRGSSVSAGHQGADALQAIKGNATRTRTSGEPELRRRYDERPPVYIASAIPSAENSPTALRDERLPRTKVFALAAFAALVLVGGGILAITHPWDPYLYQNNTTVNESVQTRPTHNTLTTLKGQDDVQPNTQESTESETSSESDEDLSHTGDEVFDTLMNAYVKLGELATQVNTAEEDLFANATSSDEDTRTKSYASARTLAVQISNVITTLTDLDTTDADESYITSRTNEIRLGNYLRNRIDQINAAWKLSLASNNPAAEKTSILYPVTKYQTSSGVNQYRQLFEKNYDSYKPVQITTSASSSSTSASSSSSASSSTSGSSGSTKE